MRSALPLAALTIAAALLLSGCVPNEPEVVPPPEPTAEPVFASDEEALAAATDAYTAYLQMSDLIAQEGGANPERLAPYVTEEWLEKEVVAFETLVGSDRRQLGNATFESPKLQQYSTAADGVTSVSAYFCLDTSGTRFVTGDGSDVTPTTRETRITVEVVFRAGDDGPSLVVEGMEPWANAGLC